MSKYVLRWKANLPAWPTDSAAVLSVWEGGIGGGNHMISNGTFSEIYWTSNIEGVAMMEAASIEAALGAAAMFFPFFISEIHEAIPWERGVAAVLASAKAVAGQ